MALWQVILISSRTSQSFLFAPRTNSGASKPIRAFYSRPEQILSSSDSVPVITAFEQPDGNWPITVCVVGNLFYITSILQVIQRVFKNDKIKYLSQVLEKLLEDFRKMVNLSAGALALLTVEQPFDDEGWRCLPSFLINIYHGGEFKILHHKLNYVLVHMDSQDTFRNIGNAIAENSGLNVIEDKRITSLEGKRSIVVYEWRKQ